MNTNEWQPIETAPKDGTDILVYEKYKDSEYIVVASNHGFYWAFDDRDTEINPTHWMPLPEPPKTK